jgi:hypothetical protein
MAVSGLTSICTKEKGYVSANNLPCMDLHDEYCSKKLTFCTNHFSFISQTSLTYYLSSHNYSIGLFLVLIFIRQNQHGVDRLHGELRNQTPHETRPQLCFTFCHFICLVFSVQQASHVFKKCLLCLFNNI